MNALHGHIGWRRKHVLVVLLEHAQQSSGQNHYFRLLLIRMYRLLGKLSVYSNIFLLCLLMIFLARW